MKTALALILSAILLLVSTASAVMTSFEGFVHVVPYDTSKVVEWSYIQTSMGSPDGYEFEVRQLETGRTLARGTALTNSISIRFRTHGHNVIWVRPFKTVDGIREVGTWENSLDPKIGVVNGQPKAWAIYVLLP